MSAPFAGTFLNFLRPLVIRSAEIHFSRRTFSSTYQKVKYLSLLMLRRFLYSLNTYYVYTYQNNRNRLFVSDNLAIFRSSHSRMALLASSNSICGLVYNRIRI